MPYTNPNDTEQIARKTVTFTATGDGAVGAVTLFTVTGTVGVKITAVCTTVTTIQAGATIEVGISGALSGALIAQTSADAPDAGEIWHDATPDAELEAETVTPWFVISDGNNIILTVDTNTVDSGVIEFYCEYQLRSAGSSVSAA